MLKEDDNFNKQSFISTFHSIAKHKHPYQVFSDFVTISAITIQNAMIKSDILEAEYMEIVGQYSKDEVYKMTQLFSILQFLLEPEPKDILGSLYMDLELGNTHNGQFFTPHHLSILLAQVSYGDGSLINDKPFVTMSEPACGAGGMVLAFVNIMIKNKQNPAEKLWVQCIDVDRVVALMCYIQLSLWGVSAEVIVGNTLSMELREFFYTPIYYIHGWDAKLKLKRQLDSMESLLKTEYPTKTKEKTRPIPSEIKQPKILPTKEVGIETGQIDLFDF